MSQEQSSTTHDKRQTLKLFEHTTELREQIAQHFQSFKRKQITLEDRRAAAVAVTVCRDGEQAAVVVTRRAASLRAHSRQWALPGGRSDPGETAIEAALRELHEEVDLRLDHSAVLGTLDDFATRSGYVITPVVVWSEAQWQSLTPNPGEVDHVHPFSFKELARTDSPILQTIEESDRKVLSMRFHDDSIFAPTGAMLYQFREVAMFGRHTRVAHFEQPLFAWK